jgi:hypothetical protein
LSVFRKEIAALSLKARNDRGMDSRFRGNDKENIGELVNN